jgi:hypothetical protein
MAKTLYMLVGPPHCGKTAAARKSGLPIVSPAGIRLTFRAAGLTYRESELWARVRFSIIERFLSGHDEVVMDASNLLRRERGAWVDGRWRRVFVMMGTSIELTAARLDAAGDAGAGAFVRRQSFEAITAEELANGEEIVTVDELVYEIGFGDVEPYVAGQIEQAGATVFEIGG